MTPPPRVLCVTVTKPYLRLFRRLLPTPSIGSVGLVLSAVAGLIALFVIMQVLARIWPRTKCLTSQSGMVQVLEMSWMNRVVSFDVADMNGDKAESVLGANQPEKIRIVLADDHPLMRRVLREVLEQEPDLEVVGEASNGSEAVELANQSRPDIVIMDIAMPVMNGVEATRRIRASNPLTSVLILTVHVDAETICSILQAGASGYLVKSILGPEVISTIRALLDGDVVLGPEISEEIVKHVVLNTEESCIGLPSRESGTLPSKHLEVLTLAARGLSNKEIARKLGYSEATVKGYFVEVFTILNVRSRTEAVFVGLKSRILNLDDLI